MKFHTTKHLLLLVVCCALVLQSNALANSVLASRYPLGLPLRSNSSTSFSMGGTSTAIVSGQNVLLRNPANLAGINKTVFSSLAILDFIAISDESTGGKSNQFDFVPRQLSFAFPMGNVGTVGFAFEKRSDATIRTSRTYDEPGLESVSTRLARDGGLTAWQIGWGQRIGSILNLGISYERVYLTLETSVLSMGGNVVVDSSHLEFGGNGIKGGFVVPLKKLSFGAFGEYFIRGNGTAATMRISEDTTIKAKPSTSEMYLPPSLSAGLAYQFNKSLLAAADIDMTLWNYFKKSEGMLGSATRPIGVGLSAGVEFVPAPDVLTPRYWETLQYRAGVRYSQLPAESASEMAVSLGTGFPLPGGGGLLDIALEYGRRTDTDYSISEDLFRIAIGINGGRKWAKSTQETY